jgi:DNA-binding MarR family transcriptional regulator
VLNLDYTALAREYMEVLFQMRNRKASKKITDSMHGEHMMLAYLSHHDGIGIPSEISNELGISTARIAATLNSLEAKGLLTRRIDELDRRRILVELTPLGREQTSNHEKHITGVVVHMLEDLGEHDAVEFLRILKKLSSRVPEDFFPPEDAIK